MLAEHAHFLMHPFTEKVYATLPVWAQNAAVSSYGFLWKRERLGGAFQTYSDQFTNREKWGQSDFSVYVAEQLRHTLIHSFNNVPYYNDLWSKAGLNLHELSRFNVEDLRRIPITPKKHLRQTPEMFIAKNFVQKNLRTYSSSGTTGTPVKIVCTLDSHRKFLAAREARSFRWAGCSITDPRSMIGGRLVVPSAVSTPPFHRYNIAEKQLYFSAFHISPTNVPHYVAALNHHRPSLFTGYAYSHFILARMMSELGFSLDYQPKALVLGSEKLSAQMKSAILRAFGARAFEEYGCVENCVLATECESGRLHVSPDFGVVEIVDEHGNPSPPGTAGRIICTALLNDAQPLIRYEIGDFASWAGEPCPCGRNHLPVMNEIVGRLEDVITGPDGREMVRFHGIFIDLPTVMEGQVIQESFREITVKIVTTGSFTQKDEDTIRARFLQRLGEVRVHVRQVSAIPRTERGKFRAVVSRLHRS